VKTQPFMVAAGSMQARAQGERFGVPEVLVDGAEAVSVPEDWALTATAAAVMTRRSLENILQFSGWS